jgi:hypothetical protein
MTMPVSLSKVSGQRFLAQQFHQQFALRFEGFMKIPKDLKIIVGVLEVPKRTEQIQRELKGFRAFEMSHVVLNELNLQTLLGSAGSSDLQIPRGSINAGDAESTAGQFERVPARPTAEVENRGSRCELQEPNDVVSFDRRHFIGSNLRE